MGCKYHNDCFTCPFEDCKSNESQVIHTGKVGRPKLAPGVVHQHQLEYAKRHYQEIKEQRAEYYKDYYQKNKERIKAQQKEYRQRRKLNENISN